MYRKAMSLLRTWSWALLEAWCFMLVLSTVTACESPLMAVVSESMEPSYHRGDMVVVTNHTGPIRMGEVVVFKAAGRPFPIVHRVVHVDTVAGEQRFVTKGDNNPEDDRYLYPPHQRWLTPADLVGRVRWFVPLLGYPSIMLREAVARVAAQK